LKAADLALEALEEKGVLAVVGGREVREGLVSSLILRLLERGREPLVLDWWGSHTVGGLPSSAPALPFRLVARYLPLASSSMYGLGGVRARVEGIVAEAVAASNSFERLLSILEVSSDPAARAALFRLRPLGQFITDGEVTPRTPLRVELHKVPILLRRTVLQLWIALLYESRAIHPTYLVVAEAGQALRRAWWVWHLLEDMRARGFRLLLADERLLRTYLRFPVFFIDSRLEDSLYAHRYRIQALAKRAGGGKAVLVKDAYTAQVVDMGR